MKVGWLHELNGYQLASMVTTISLLIFAMLFGIRVASAVFLLIVMLSVCLWLVTSNKFTFIVLTFAQILLWGFGVIDSPVSEFMGVTLSGGIVNFWESVFGAVGTFLRGLFELIVMIVWWAFSILIAGALVAYMVIAIFSGKAARGYRTYQKYSDRFDD